MRVNARFEGVAEQQVTYLATRSGLKVSDVLRDSVDFYYRHVRGQTGQLKHLADCVGQGDSGRSDISTHVKKYVGESLDAKFTRAPAPARKPPAAKAKRLASVTVMLEALAVTAVVNAVLKPLIRLMPMFSPIAKRPVNQYRPLMV